MLKRWIVRYLHTVNSEECDAVLMYTLKLCFTSFKSLHLLTLSHIEFTQFILPI